MSFTTFEFFLFALMALVVYYIIPKKVRWVWLLILSYMYYFSYHVTTVWMMILTTAVTYTGGILLGKLNSEKPDKDADRETKKAFKKDITNKKKKVVLCVILLSFGVLAVCKYTNFMIGNINGILSAFGSSGRLSVLKLTLPLGISFYTFQSVSYVVDVYRGKHEPQKNFFKYALFVSFFPQLLQGPIGRYERLGEQLYEGHAYDLKNIQFGLQRILWGMLKKMVLADRVNAAVTLIFNNYWNYGGWINVFGVILYSIQLYADFSGGIDITIGIAQMFGITMDENFRQPYFSRSISEFWRRWHITLGTWMKDYIFYPMSLSKAMNKFGKWGKKHFGNVGRTLPICFANLVIFFVVGIWHGASWKYIAYGMYNGVIIAFSNLVEPLYNKALDKLHIRNDSKPWKLWMILRTFILVNIGWYFDMGTSLRAALTMIKQSVVSFSFSQFTDGSLLTLGLEARDYVIILVGCIVVFIISVLKEKGINIRESIASKNIVIRWTLYYVLILVIIMFGYTGGVQAFIYANF